MLTQRGGAISIRIRALPGSPRSQIQGLYGDALKVAVQARPEKGKANKAILDVLAKSLRLRPAQLSLRSGEKTRDKRVAVIGVSCEELETRIRDALEKGK